MDFPSASTFGLRPSRRTAIALPFEVTVEYELDEDLDQEPDPGADKDDYETSFDIVFEPWDEDLESYVIGELGDGDDDDDDDEDEDEEGFRS